MQKFDYLQKMELVYQISIKLAGDKAGYWNFIKQAIARGEDADVILKTIKEDAQDNLTAVQDMLGVKLTNDILNTIT